MKLLPQDVKKSEQKYRVNESTVNIIKLTFKYGIIKIYEALILIFLKAIVF